jgi:hypothetical protein
MKRNIRKKEIEKGELLDFENSFDMSETDDIELI